MIKLSEITPHAPRASWTFEGLRDEQVLVAHKVAELCNKANELIERVNDLAMVVDGGLESAAPAPAEPQVPERVRHLANHVCVQAAQKQYLNAASTAADLQRELLALLSQELKSGG